MQQTPSLFQFLILLYEYGAILYFVLFVIALLAWSAFLLMKRCRPSWAIKWAVFWMTWLNSATDFMVLSVLVLLVEEVGLTVHARWSELGSAAGIDLWRSTWTVLFAASSSAGVWLLRRAVARHDSLANARSFAHVYILCFVVALLSYLRSAGSGRSHLGDPFWAGVLGAAGILALGLINRYTFTPKRIIPQQQRVLFSIAGSSLLLASVAVLFVSVRIDELPIDRVLSIFVLAVTSILGIPEILLLYQHQTAEEGAAVAE